jgi:hypothetical protein
MAGHPTIPRVARLHPRARRHQRRMVSTVAPKARRGTASDHPVVSVSISAYFTRSRRRIEPHYAVPSGTATQFPAGFRGARTCTRPPHDRSEALRLHPQQYGRSGSVLHRHYLERPSAAGRTQPRRLLAHAALDTVASDCRRRVRERGPRARLRAISQNRVGLRLRGATLQIGVTSRDVVELRNAASTRSISAGLDRLNEARRARSRQTKAQSL